jgi:hypothetical protein
MRGSERGPGEQVDMGHVFANWLRNFGFRACFATSFLLDPVIKKKMLFDSQVKALRVPMADLSESETDAVHTDLKRLGGAKAEAEWDELLLRNLHGDSSSVLAWGP